MSESARITDLLEITRRLTAVLEREVELLRARAHTELEALQRDKATLTAAYETQIGAHGGEAEAPDAPVPELRAELEATIERFCETLRRNERNLRAARHTSERVLRAIADEIENRRRENSGYAAGGARSPASRAAARPPVSLAFDQRY